MIKTYITEREGQIDFFENYYIPWQENDEILVANTDGIWKGNLFEFKLNINNINSVAFQAIKYLSKLRIRGQSVPANFILVSLNTTIAYVFHSEDYRDDIQKIYVGAASQHNSSFIADDPFLVLDFSNSTDAITLKGILNETNYMPVDLDEECILGWAERYYRENPKASKGDFLGDATGQVPIVGEIRDPKHFKGLIKPYKEKTNAKFQYLMDCLNDRLRKKDLGAFYTPISYAEKAAELVRMAIQRVPKGNDYIILDRCAGTGNLESVLTDEELSHCILSTYEYFEYKVLQERLGDKVRFIVPPTEAHVEYANGCIMNADAMSEEYINNPDIKKYVDDSKCTIIGFENPPYFETNNVHYTDENKKRHQKSKTNYVHEEFKNKAKTSDKSGSAARDLSNLFIWSMFEYYLRYDSDSYIVFSPVKYFKIIDLISKKFKKGFCFNRKYFHATPSTISCIFWENINENKTDFWKLSIYDCENDNSIYLKDIIIKHAEKGFLPYYDFRKFKNDNNSTVFCFSDGYPLSQEDKRIDTSGIVNDNIIAYLGASAYPISPLKRQLVRTAYFHHGMTFPLRADNYLEKLPIWVAKHIPLDNWYEKDVYVTSSDGGDAYTKDKDFLKSCLLYTCLSNQNKCLSFLGSDGREYQNELCFDDSRKEKPLAYQDLQKYSLNNDEKELIMLWEKIVKEARNTKNYNPHWNYGVYQITKELDTWHEEGTGKSKKKIYDYPRLHGDLDTLRTLLKSYYKKYITPKMFEYELIK